MKVVRVDMTGKTIRTEEVPAAYAGLGGRGITSMMINAEVPAACNPLGPENKLIFAPGLLSGTTLVNTSRLSIGAKSPLTGGIKESNAGGTAAAALGKLGITAIVIEGQPPEGDWSILRIDQNGSVSLESGREYLGMRTYALAEKLFSRYGEKNAILCIGPAGEYRLGSASIQASDVDGRTCRSAARGGIGAVMGSKGLKAVVIDQRGQSPDALKDPEAFKEAAKTFAQAITKNGFCGKMLPAQGTAVLVSIVNSLGGFPSLNATRGVMEGWEKVSGEALAKLINERGGQTGHRGCSQCVIRCSNVFVDKDGKYVTGSLEYETIWSMGGMTGIADLDTIARLDFLCDDIGVDTINTGVAIAVAMDAGYRPFGDGKAAIEMLEEIGKGSEFGRIIGNGPVAVGRHLNHHRVPAVKGQSISAYDPRALQGFGVTYSTSPMGADHTAGGVLADYLTRKLNPLQAEGQVAASRAAQVASASIDNLGLCLLALSVFASEEAGQAMAAAVNAKLGTQFTFKDLFGFGVRILQAELDFNRKAGLTSKDDRLPEFFFTEPLLPHNKVFAVDEKEIEKTFSF